MIKTKVNTELNIHIPPGLTEEILSRLEVAPNTVTVQPAIAADGKARQLVAFVLVQHILEFSHIYHVQYAEHGQHLCHRHVRLVLVHFIKS